MEPICTAVGVAAGIASIVTVIGKSVAGLYRLKDRFKDADLNITLIIGQLQTITAALHQVEAWMKETPDLETQHPRFLGDLRDSLKCCNLLVIHLDEHISKLDRTHDHQLKLDSRVIVVWEEQIAKDYLTRLNHQISALNLCLTAFKCRTPRDQARLLENKESQRVLSRVRDDATSLLASMDGASCRTMTSRNSIASNQTRYSKVFEFDSILLTHQIYQNTFRSMLRKASTPEPKKQETESHERKAASDMNHERKASSDMSQLERTISAKDSARIDSLIKKDARKLGKEVKILALGSKTERTAIVKYLRLHCGEPFELVEIERYRRSIISLIVLALVTIMDYVDSGTGLINEHNHDDAQVVRDLSKSGSPDWQVTDASSLALRCLWENWHIRGAFSRMNQDCTTAYFLSSIPRICLSYYKPSDLDIINCPDKFENIRETVLKLEPLTARIAEIKQSNLPKLIQCFDGVTACMFMLDLTAYDEPSEHEHHTNKLALQLAYLNSILNSIYLRRSAKLIFFTNVSAFRRKIANSPFNLSFADYEGGEDADVAIKYLIKICQKANHSRLPFFWHICDVNDESNASFIRQSINSIPVANWVKYGLS